MAAHNKGIQTDAERWIGQPVYVELRNGSAYMGRIVRADKGLLVLAGRKVPAQSRKRGKAPARRLGPGRARVSAFLPELLGPMLGGGSLFGGGLFGGGGGGGGVGGNPLAGAGAAGAAEAGALAGGGLGFGNMLTMMGKALPMIKMGYGMIKTIIPMLQGFK